MADYWPENLQAPAAIRFDVFLLTLMMFETWLVPIAHLLTQNSGNSIWVAQGCTGVGSGMFRFHDVGPATRVGHKVVGVPTLQVVKSWERRQACRHLPKARDWHCKEL